MHTFLIILAVALIASLLFVVVQRARSGRVINLCNIGEGEYTGGAMTRLTDAAITTRHLLFKTGTDKDHVAVMAATANIPQGTVPDEASAAELPVELRLLGVYNGPLKMVAAAAMATAGVELFANAAGKVVVLGSLTTGTWYSVGYLLNTSGADGDVVLVAHHTPRKLIVT